MLDTEQLISKGFELVSYDGDGAYYKLVITFNRC